MYTPCESKHQPAQTALTIRAHASAQDLPNVLGQSYARIMQHVGQLDQMAQVGAPFVIYYDMNMDNLDIEIGFLTQTALPGVEGIQSTVIPEGEIVTCTYTGPYPEMMDAYQALTEFASENNLQPSGVTCEIYLNDPACTPPEQLQTQIVFPLK